MGPRRLQSVIQIKVRRRYTRYNKKVGPSGKTRKILLFEHQYATMVMDLSSSAIRGIVDNSAVICYTSFGFDLFNQSMKVDRFRENSSMQQIFSG